MKGIKCFLFSHMLMLLKHYGNIYKLHVDQLCVEKVLEYCNDTFKVPFDISLLHEFQKFQVVLDMLYDFNCLLMTPIERQHPAIMYKGGLMYTLFTKTDNEQHLDFIIQTCFKKNSRIMDKFIEILSTLHEILE